MQDYISRLLTQFKEAKGIKNLNINSSEISEKFISYVIERGKDGIVFCNYLEHLGLNNYKFASTIEYGKGNLDSIVKSNASTIVSPFGNTVEGVEDSRIIVAGLAVSQNMPYLVSSNNKLELHFGYPYRTVMTHNVYTPGMIRNWEDLHNNSSYSIIYGVFGKITDEDRENKVKTVKELSEKLDGDYTYSYDTKRDAYFCAVGSNFPMKKVKVKTMNRDLGIDYHYTR